MNQTKFLKCVLLLACAALPARHSALLAENAKPAFHWPEGKRVAVSLSFDDARLSQMDVGLPLFDRYGAKVTFVVNPPNMAKRLEAWKKAVANGHEIGNHTVSHPCSGNFSWSRGNALENYTPAMIEGQMDGANAEIARLVGVHAVTFAYPCGQKFIGRGAATQSYVPLVARRFLVGRGFRDEAANDPLFCDLSQVFGVESDGLSFEQMKAAVTAAAQQGRWLVFAGHEIGVAGHQTTLVASLEQFLKYAQNPANGVWLDTMEQVARYIRAQRGDK
jgi:peptidoglycan/xylan/chitin deacetylase (PgdA/CDA1 family)